VLFTVAYALANLPSSAATTAHSGSSGLWFLQVGRSARQLIAPDGMSDTKRKQHLQQGPSHPQLGGHPRRLRAPTQPHALGHM